MWGTRALRDDFGEAMLDEAAKEKPTHRLRGGRVGFRRIPKLGARLCLLLRSEAGGQDSDRRGHCHVATEATGGTTDGDGGAELHMLVEGNGDWGWGSNFEACASRAERMIRACRVCVSCSRDKEDGCLPK
jgi:hypothetical protein